MARLRFSLAGLAGLVAFVAVACCALVNAAPWIASVSVTVVFLLLGFASIRAVVKPGGFWTGFAIAGWLYVAVAFGPFTGQFGRSLVTTLLINKGANLMPRANQPTPVTQYYAYATPLTINQSPVPATSAPQPVYQPSLYRPVTIAPSVSTDFVDSFLHIGQALWTLIIAAAGGITGMYLAAPNVAGRHADQQGNSTS